MHRRLLEQMECLCITVQNVEDRMGKSHMQALGDKRSIRNSKKCVSEWIKGSNIKKVPGNLRIMI